MTTKVYGCSDDLIEIEGDVRGESSCYGTDEEDRGALVVLSDGTLLEVKYGKHDCGIWGITLVKRGSLFDRIDQCDDEDADVYSDVAHFRDGIAWAYAAAKWESMK